MTASNTPDALYRFAWRNPSGIEYRSHWMGTLADAEAWCKMLESAEVPHWPELAAHAQTRDRLVKHLSALTPPSAAMWSPHPDAGMRSFGWELLTIDGVSLAAAVGDGAVWLWAPYMERGRRAREFGLRKGRGGRHTASRIREGVVDHAAIAEGEEKLKRMFPSPNARAVADSAMDAIDASEPMSRFIDRWIEAYIAAGGKTNVKFD